MKSLTVPIILLALLGFLAGGVFIFNQENKITVENSPIGGSQVPVKNETATTTAMATAAATTTESNQQKNIVQQSEELIVQAQSLVSEAQKFLEEEKAEAALIEKAKEKSSQVKGIYAGGAASRNYLRDILKKTELNCLVIDIKESYGQNLLFSFKSLISELHQQDVWMIARAVLFRDSSLILEKPEWYLMSTTSDVTTTDSATTGSTTTDETINDATTTLALWRDGSGQYWLDPKNEEVRKYLIEFLKKAIDYGFDELQFDYIRYPDDYKIISGQEKIKVIGELSLEISEALKNYKPSIILSADIFGYIATQFNSYEIGQSLSEAGKYFDYISFMLYPSHFYGGFSVQQDLKHQLPALYFIYEDEATTTIDQLVSNNPYQVVLRSVLSAADYLDSYGSKAKIRPWLQDFNLKADIARGIFYDQEKVKLEIEAAEGAGSSGWLLWNPSSVYTQEALDMIE